MTTYHLLFPHDDLTDVDEYQVSGHLKNAPKALEHVFGPLASLTAVHLANKLMR